MQHALPQWHPLRYSPCAFCIAIEGVHMTGGQTRDERIFAKGCILLLASRPCVLHTTSS